MNSLYRPGVSPIHRLSVGLKFLVLTAVLVGLLVVPKNWILANAALALVLMLFEAAGYNIRALVETLFKLRYLLVIVLIPQICFFGPFQGLVNFEMTITGILLAMLFTATTKTSELLALLEKVFRSESFALLIALSLNSIALVAEIWKGIVEAGKARGVRIRPIRQIINLFVISLKQADDYAEALAARGIHV